MALNHKVISFAIFLMLMGIVSVQGVVYTDTGVEDTNNFTVSTSGSDRLVVDANGNLQIHNDSITNFGAFRYDSANSKLQFSHDNGTTFSDVGSGSGSSGNGTNDYIIVYLDSDQQNSPAGTKVAFTNVSSSSGLSLSSNTVTLTAGKTYKMQSGLTIYDVGAFTNAEYTIYDFTNGVSLGIPGRQSENGNVANNPIAQAIIQPVSNIDVGVNFTGGNGALDIANTDSFFSVVELGLNNITTSSTTNISTGGGAFYGSLTWVETAFCAFDTTGTNVFSDLTEPACDNNARVSQGLTTSNLSVGSSEGETYQIKFDSLPAGFYRFESTGVHLGSASTTTCSYRASVNDGEINGTPATQFTPGGITFEGDPGVVSLIYIPTDKGVSTIKLEAQADTGFCRVDATTAGGFRDPTLALYYFPLFGSATNESLITSTNGNTSVQINGGSTETIFTNNGAESMRIIESGDVGIGTGTPIAKLHIEGTSLGDKSLLHLVNTTSDPPEISFDGGIDIEKGRLNFVSINSTGSSNTMFWLENGNINLDGDGNTLIMNPATSIGSSNACFSGTGGSESLGICTSSILYKENIYDIENGLTMINKLRPVEFNWKNSGEKDYGLIAEEVEKFIPELVDYNEDDNTVVGVNYRHLSAVNTKAIQEIKEEKDNEIEDLQKQIDELKLLLTMCHYGEDGK